MESGFDYLVLTASNEGQAGAYRSELDARGLGGNAAPRTLVVPDPGGRRVGSGIATLRALGAVVKDRRGNGGGGGSIAGLLEGLRVLVLHCGGDSRRLPAYAAHGKIFAPLPLPGDTPRTLFDLIVEDMAGISLGEGGGVVIATGDVFVGLSGQGVDLSGPGFTGVAWADSPARGSRHGVYVLDGRGGVVGFVHKPDAAAAHESGAVRADGRVLIDTGVIGMDAHAAERWLRLAGLGEGRGLLPDSERPDGSTLDLYGEMLPAMARRATCAAVDWRGGLAFSAEVVPSSPFMHIGTTRELLDSLAADRPPDSRLRRYARARGEVPPGWCVHNTVLESAPVRPGSGVVIEGSHLIGSPECGGDNVVVGVPGEVREPVRLGRGWGVVCLPVVTGSGDAWVGLAFGSGDDFKSSESDGGTIGNESLAGFRRRAALGERDLWGAGDERTLWSARLWRPGRAADLLASVGWLLRGESPDRRWSGADRWSAEEVMDRVDHTRLREARDKVLARV